MKAVLLCTACALLAAGSARAQTGPIVTTTEGPVQGYTAGSVNNFFGIRYAAAPTGSARWTAPGAPPNHSGITVQATAYGFYCPQGESELGFGGGNEDCLYANVQVPVSATPGSNLPVMVWIHGGGLTTGSGQEYDGSAFVQEQNVVFVSFNYRLGLLGFLADPALLDAHGSSGNYGLQDQQAAIAWVRANAVNFGGNPNGITIFGESAGGQSTIDQLASPLLGPIHSAVIESGAYARKYPTQAQAQTQGVSIATALGCTDPNTAAACLRAVPPATLVNLVGAGVIASSTINITPNVDGYVLPLQPLQALYKGKFPRVPVIDGSNHDEYRLFVAENDIFGTGPETYASFLSTVDTLAGSFAPQVIAEYPVPNYPSPNFALAALATDYAFSCGAVLVDALLSKYVPVYSYELNDPNVPDIFLPFDPNMPSLGDSHAAELPYLYPAFRNAALGLGPANFSPAQVQLTQAMRADWASLARYGRPFSPTGGIWPRYSLGAHAKLSLISPAPQTENGFIADHKCDFWLPFLLRQASLPSTTPY